MGTSKIIAYAPQVEQDLIIEVVQFLTNNVGGYFNYHINVSAYKDLCKYLKNYFLNVAFTKTPSVVYQNYLREFWCTVVVDLLKPPTYDSEPRPLIESLIRFIVKNGKTSLFFNFQTFVQTTRLDYNNGNYVALPSTEVMKAELLKLGLHNERNVEESASVLVNKTLLSKTWFPIVWRNMTTFVIQVLGGNKFSTDQLNSSQQMIIFSLLTGVKIDIGEIIFNDLVTRLIDTPRKKYIAYLGSSYVCLKSY
ncbi:hypothetical protein Tco_0210509 [Tanacetum coccineum]